MYSINKVLEYISVKKKKKKKKGVIQTDNLPTMVSEKAFRKITLSSS